jgi:hypothetical protein
MTVLPSRQRLLSLSTAKAYASKMVPSAVSRQTSALLGAKSRFNLRTNLIVCKDILGAGNEKSKHGERKKKKTREDRAATQLYGPAGRHPSGDSLPSFGISHQSHNRSERTLPSTKQRSKQSKSYKLDKQGFGSLFRDES